MIYNDILETIGNTPVVRLNRVAPSHVEMYVKVEAFNPMASVKDRLAFAIVDDAEKSGELKPGQTVVEATSGNTGIALAALANAQGTPIEIAVPEGVPEEKKAMLRFLGAELIEVEPASGAGQWATKTRWAAKVMKTKFSNVAIRDGFAYGLDDGILSCVEIETGTRRWKKGRFGYGQILMVDDESVQVESRQPLAQGGDPIG